MSDGALIAIISALGVPIVGAAAGAVFTSFARQREVREAAERSTQSAQARRFGERIGVLESFRDREIGRREGMREAREEVSRKGHVQ